MNLSREAERATTIATELHGIIDTLNRGGLLTPELFATAKENAERGRPIMLHPAGLDASARLERLEKLLPLIGTTRQTISDCYGNALVAQFESENPFGSHYDRVYAALLEKHIRARPTHTKILELSSGSAGISAAGVCNVLGIEAKIVMPDSRFPIRQQLAERLGAEIIHLPQEEGVEGASKIIQAMWRQEFKRGRPFLNHSNTDDTLPATGRIATEAVNTFGQPFDLFFTAIGNGTTMRGIGTPLRERSTRVIGVRYEAGNPSDRSLQMPGNDKVDIDSPHLKAFVPDELRRIPLSEIVTYAHEQNLGLTSAMVKMAAEEEMMSTPDAGRSALVIDYDSASRY